MAPPDFPYPLVAVRGAQLYGEWQKLQAEWRGEGCSAVVLGGDQDMLFHKAHFEWDTRSVEEVLAASRKMTGQDYFARKMEKWPTFTEDMAEGEWPKDAPKSARTLEADLNNPTNPKRWIARVPTAKSYEIPAYLHWGNYNDCPSSEEHVAVLRYWNEKYGIEVFAMRDESVQYLVERRPANRTDGLALAHEQILYCGEGYEPGMSVAYEMAVSLPTMRSWYFWWD